MPTKQNETTKIEIQYIREDIQKLDQKLDNTCVEIKAAVKEWVDDLHKRIDMIIAEHRELEKRVGALEDKVLVIMTKFTIYSAIAILFGNLLATTIWNLLQKQILK